MGRPHTEATKEKIRQSKLGNKASAETRAKMSAAHTGKPHPHKPTFTGMVHTEESKEKMSKARKGRPLGVATRKKMSVVRKGVPKSEVTRKKMSEHRQDMSHPANRSRSEATSRSNALRNIQGKGYQVKGHYKATKAIRSPVAYRSVSIELRLMELLDKDPSVLVWESPLVIRYQDSRGFNRFTLPDFIVTYQDGSRRVIEGKGPHLLAGYFAADKFRAVKEWCVEQDVPFYIVTTDKQGSLTWEDVS